MGYAVSTIRFIDHSEGASGVGGTLYGDIINRPLRDLLTALGGSPGTGLTTSWESANLLLQQFNAANFPGSTNAAKVTAMIAAAKAAGSPYGFIPRSMLGYGLTGTVTYDPTVQLIREGGPLHMWDLKAYGAIGDGNTSHDDTLAIQAALDAHPCGHPVYAPRGLYKVTAPLSAGPNGNALNLYGDFSYGTGFSDGPMIYGTFNDTLLAINGSSLASPDGGNPGWRVIGMGFGQTSTGTNASCVTVRGVQAPATFDSCYFQSGYHGLYFTQNDYLTTVRACTFDGGKAVGGIGLRVVGHCSVDTVTLVGWDLAITVQGSGPTSITNFRGEVNRTALYLGYTDVADGVTVRSASFEANQQAVLVNFIRGSDLSGLNVLCEPVNAIDHLTNYGIRVEKAIASSIRNAFVWGDLAGGGAIAGVSINGTGNFNLYGADLTLESVYSILNPGSTRWSITQPASGTLGLQLVNCNAPVGWIVGVLAVNSATPSLEQSSTDHDPQSSANVYWTTANTNPTTITDFTESTVGCPVTIKAGDTNTTIQHGTKIFLKGGVNRTLALNETISLQQFSAGRWDEI